MAAVKKIDGVPPPRSNLVFQVSALFHHEWPRFHHEWPRFNLVLNLPRFWSPPISFWSRFAGETNISTNPAWRHFLSSSSQINAVAQMDPMGFHVCFFYTTDHSCKKKITSPRNKAWNHGKHGVFSKQRHPIKASYFWGWAAGPTGSAWKFPSKNRGLPGISDFGNENIHEAVGSTYPSAQYSLKVDHFDRCLRPPPSQFGENNRTHQLATGLRLRSLQTQSFGVLT